MQLTKNFHANEFICKCGNCSLEDCKMDIDFILKLQSLRDVYDKPMTPSSGYRCPDHNQAVGGSKGSFHMKGLAADFPISDRAERVLLIKHALKLGLTVGLGKGFLHFDNRLFQTVFDY